MATLTSVVTLAMNSVFYPDFYAREAKKVFRILVDSVECGTTATEVWNNCSARLCNVSSSWGHSIASKIDFIKFMVVCHIHQIKILKIYETI